MRVPHGIVALMGWLVIAGYGGKIAVADDRDELRAFNHRAVAEMTQRRKGEAALERGDYATALALLQPLAGGDEAAMYDIGKMYEEGKGVPRDMAMARAYMEKADRFKWIEAHLWLQAHGFLPTKNPRAESGGSNGPRRAAADDGSDWPPVCAAIERSPDHTVQGTLAHRLYGACIVARTACIFSGENLSARTGTEQRRAMAACVGRMMKGTTGTEQFDRHGSSESDHDARSGGKVRVSLAHCRGNVSETANFGADVAASLSACTAVINAKAATPHQVAEAYAWRAIGRVNKEQYAQAVSDGDSAIRMEPTIAEAYYGRGEGYFFEERYDLALADFDTAMKLRPEQKSVVPMTLTYRGAIYRYKGQFAQAIADLDRAIELDSTIAGAFYFRSLAERNIGRVADADRDMRTAKRIDPNIR